MNYCLSCQLNIRTVIDIPKIRNTDWDIEFVGSQKLGLHNPQPMWTRGRTRQADPQPI